MQTWGFGRRRRVFQIAVLVTFLLGLYVIHHDKSRDRVLNYDLFKDHTVPTAQADRKPLCAAHDFSPSLSPTKKLYDLTLLNTELDWLEIRLHTLAPYVDYFVVIEFPTTYSSNAKPTLLDKPAIWERFARFHDKIIHRIVEDPIVSERAWDHEDYMRNALMYSIFPSLQGTPAQPNKGDVLLVSDIDEVVRPESAVLLKSCEIPRRLTLRTRFFYYSYQWMHVGPQWPHPQATTYEGSIEKTVRPNDLRQDILAPGSILLRPFASLLRWWDRATIWDAGWHCSSCFSTVQEYQTKMGSFSHMSLNTEENRDASKILERIRNGWDLFGREGENYSFVERDELDLPEYVWSEWKERERFGWMIERTGEDGGFVEKEG